MKALMHYDASPSVRALIETVEPSELNIALIAESDEAGFVRNIGETEIMLHVLRPVTAEIMKAAPGLRLVQKIGVGVDAIDLDYAKANGIAVCNMPGINTAAVAEHAVGLMLACLRRTVPISTELHADNAWPARPELLDGAGEIGQRTVGLIGYGAVGRRLAAILAAFGAEVIAYDPMCETADIELVPLDELLARADIISFHVPLTPETTNLLNAERIAGMNPGAIVINTARGPLIDETALAAALTDGRIAAAGLDVLANEPSVADHPLRGLDNVILTPHIAWLTDGTWRRSIDVVRDNCRRLKAGRPLLHRIV